MVGAVRPVCSEANCSQPSASRGLCNKHYMRFRRHGTTSLPETPEERFWAKVDKSRECWIWTGPIVGGGYGSMHWDGKMRSAAHVSLLLAGRPLPEGLVADRTCYEPACINPDHLRPATRKQDQENRRSAQSNSTTGIRGVFWHSKNQSWFSVVGHNKQKLRIGTFHDIGEAEAAVTEMRNTLYTHNDADRNQRGKRKSAGR